MPSNPANFQNIVPLNVGMTLNRLGVSQITIGPLYDINGGAIAFNSATVFELWVAPADPALPIPVDIQKITPLLPLLWTAGGGSPYANTVKMRLCTDDINALGVGAGNISYVLICSIDGGNTIDTVATGVITIPTFLTSSW